MDLKEVSGEKRREGKVRQEPYRPNGETYSA